jgi:hypothetical protein
MEKPSGKNVTTIPRPAKNTHPARHSNHYLPPYKKVAKGEREVDSVFSLYNL